MRDRIVKPDAGLRSKGGGFVVAGGGLTREVFAPAAVVTLGDLNFTSGPTAQAFPATAAALATELGDAAAEPDLIWLCDEASGNLVDEITAEPLAPVNSPLHNRNGTGLPSSKKCIELTATANQQFAATADNTIGDPGLTSFAAVIVFRTPVVNSLKGLIGKQQGAAGWWMRLDSGGGYSVQFHDGTVADSVSRGSDVVQDGAWHVVAIVLDRTANTLGVYSDATGTFNTTDTSTLGDVTNTDDFAFGDNIWGTGRAQIAYCALFSGAAAEAIDATAMDSFWVHGTSPTALLSTATRSAAVSLPWASDNTIAHYGVDQLAIGYHAGWTTGDYGLWAGGALTNLLTYSYEMSNWVQNATTTVDYAADSPDGMRNASTVTAGAANDHVDLLFTTSAATEYTISVYIMESTVGATGRLIFYDETGVGQELASQVFTASSAWQKIKVTATTNAGQVSSSIRVEIDVNTETIIPAMAMAYAGKERPEVITTTGSTAASVRPQNIMTGNYIYSPAGEVECTVIPVLESGALRAIYDNKSSSNRQRYTYLDGAGRLNSLMRDDTATSEDTILHSFSALTFGAEAVTRYQWDTAGSLGFEGVLYEGAVSKDGEALPYEGTHTVGYSAGVTLGGTNAGGAFEFNGYIQRIRFFNGPNV